MKKGMLFLGLIIFLISPALSQEESKPAKFENVEWNMIKFLNFKTGKINRAKEIIEIYDTAGKNAGSSEPQKYWLETGEYDLMVIWKLDNGLSDLEWEISPVDVKWRTELVKLQGSEEATKKLTQEFSELIEESVSYLSRKEM